VTTKAAQLLAVETADAWFEYGESCRQAREGARYDEVEPWAWNRLQARLHAVAARRSALSAPVRVRSAA
jgi:hypothetical protein